MAWDNTWVRRFKAWQCRARDLLCTCLSGNPKQPCNPYQALQCRWGTLGAVPSAGLALGGAATCREKGSSKGRPLLRQEKAARTVRHTHTLTHMRPSLFS